MPRPLETAIQIVKRLGFRVFMRNEANTFMLFVEGNNIGYLQRDYTGGYSLSTVHVPNTSTGTGYSIERGLSDDDLTADRLRRAFVHAPDWAASRDLSSVRKYRDIADYKSASSFNSEYEER